MIYKECLIGIMTPCQMTGEGNAR